MTNQVRPWLEQEVSPELRRLLIAARTQEPSRGDVQRFIAQLALAKASCATDTGSESTIGGATGSAIVGAKWSLLSGSLVGIVAVSVAVVGVQRLTAPSNPAFNPGTASVNRAELEKPFEPVGTEPAVQQPREVIPRAAPVPELKLNRHRPRIASKTAELQVNTTPTEPMAPTSSQSAQFPEAMSHAGLAPQSMPSEHSKESQSAFVDRARNALNHGMPSDTLRILELYEHEFQTRTFVPEALQLRLRANLRLGNGAAAKVAAETLAARYPSTPQGREALAFLGK